jgi:WD40 repeat protein
MVLMMAGLALTGCASLPRIPANVILHDVHNNGYALAFDSESKLLASGGSEGRIRLWRMPEGKGLGGWQAHEGSLQGLHFVDHGREILSAGYDASLARWTRDGKLLKRLATPSPITDMVADEATALVVTGHRDGHVRLWRLTDLSLLHDLPLHRGAVRAVAWHPSTRQLASGGTDGRVFHWHFDEPARALPAPPTDAQDLAFAPDGSFLLGSGWFNLFRWRLADASLTVLPTAHHGIVKSISFARDGQSLASIGRQTDSAVYLLDAQTGGVLQRFQPHELCGTAVRLSPDGRYLASTSDDANIHLWDLRNLLPEQTFYSK